MRWKATIPTRWFPGSIVAESPVIVEKTTTLSSRISPKWACNTPKLCQLKNGIRKEVYSCSVLSKFFILWVSFLHPNCPGIKFAFWKFSFEKCWSIWILCFFEFATRISETEPPDARASWARYLRASSGSLLAVRLVTSDSWRFLCYC